MKKYLIIIALSFCGCIAHAQMMGPGMMRGGMMWNDKEVRIPEKLPLPKDRHWIDELESILASEKLSRLQYQTDEAKYGVHMPYAMIIPQENNHIAWIEKMLTAYGLSEELTKVEEQKIVETKTLEQAYKLGLKMEAYLVSHYEELIKKAPDETSQSVLGTILLQSRFHYVMFDHALQMGSHMGGGMMGRGR